MEDIIKPEAIGSTALPQEENMYYIYPVGPMPGYFISAEKIEKIKESEKERMRNKNKKPPKPPSRPNARIGGIALGNT